MSESVSAKLSILYAEDDQALANLTKTLLIAAGYRVTIAHDGTQAIKIFKQDKVDAILLDVMMPGKDGYLVAEQIRLIDKDVPIIFLTAKSQAEDRLKGLRTGADDYISKPFEMEELLLKLKAILRRSAGQTDSKTYKEARFGGCSLNFDSHRLQVPGEEILLTYKEAAILQMLCLNAGEIVKRNEILILVWGEDSYFNGRSLDVFMSKIRKMLKADPSLEIISLHGLGYRLVSQNGVTFA